MRKTPEDWVRSKKMRSCKDLCLWEGSWRKERYSGHISALCSEQAEPRMRCPATEPDTGNRSPCGWLEGSGKNRTAVGSWRHLWEHVRTDSLRRWGREGGLKTALGAAQVSVTAIIRSSLSSADAPALLHITAPCGRKDCPD